MSRVTITHKATVNMSSPVSDGLTVWANWEQIFHFVGGGRHGNAVVLRATVVLNSEIKQTKQFWQKKKKKE